MAESQLDALNRAPVEQAAGWLAAVTDADRATREALSSGNATYREPFGHVFLNRAAGRSADVMPAEPHRRLANDERSERAAATEQLAQITRLRLEKLLAR